jgi:hypothetical protein
MCGCGWACNVPTVGGVPVIFYKTDYARMSLSHPEPTLAQIQSVRLSPLEHAGRMMARLELAPTVG